MNELHYCFGGENYLKTNLSYAHLKYGVLRYYRNMKRKLMFRGDEWNEFVGRRGSAFNRFQKKEFNNLTEYIFCIF